MPNYYIMQLNQGMAETVACEMPSKKYIDNCRWLSEKEISFYSDEFKRTGFQGGLQWYRCNTNKIYNDKLKLFGNQKIKIPSYYISGEKDWGTYQFPGNYEKMKKTICEKMLGCYFVEGAGHWVQQEKPDKVIEQIFNFLKQIK